ncbi:MAG: D-aminoacyl-tRNA deacylase [Sphaerochaetaceae bacterium]|jgi:D-tyrosyl-tRNA(Tyr) deacylase
MKAVIQRVSSASVHVDQQLHSNIDGGLLVYLGVEKGDNEQTLQYMVHKCVNLRIFSDDKGKMNLSLLQKPLQMLVVSQFTLCASLKKGNRPSFDYAADPAVALHLYELFIQKIQLYGITVKTGVFGAHMHVSSVNDGPVTIIIDSADA